MLQGLYLAAVYPKYYSTGNFILSDLAPKNKPIYQILWCLASIKSFIFLSTGVKCSSIDWLDLIGNSWARIDVLRDRNKVLDI